MRTLAALRAEATHAAERLGRNHRIKWAPDLATIGGNRVQHGKCTRAGCDSTVTVETGCFSGKLRLAEPIRGDAVVTQCEGK